MGIRGWKTCKAVRKCGKQGTLHISKWHPATHRVLGRGHRAGRKAWSPFSGEQLSPVPSLQEQSCQLWRPQSLSLTPSHPWAGVRCGPAELSAGQIDLTGVTSPYSMFNMTYKEEDFDRLVQLSDYNVRSSQDTILQALRTILKRRAPEARPPRVQT